MKLLKGFKLVSLTDTEIVQEAPIGETGHCIMRGNPNPDPVEHQKLIDEIADIFMQARAKNQAS